MCDGDGNEMKSGKWAIWFKPMDMLKVNLGTIAKDLNKESIEYGGCLLGYDSFGASLDINVDAFSATILYQSLQHKQSLDPHYNKS